MTSQEPDPILESILSGLRDGETACLRAQGVVSNARPFGQIATSIVHLAEKLITSDLPEELIPPDDGDYLSRTVATVVTAAALVAAEVAGLSATAPVNDSRERHDINKGMAEAADQILEDGVNDAVLDSVMKELVEGYQNDAPPKVIFQVQVNQVSSTPVGATNITIFNPYQLGFTSMQSHGTFFIRHRMLIPQRTEWTDWELSGGGTLGYEVFDRVLKIEGRDEWIQPKGRLP